MSKDKMEYFYLKIRHKRNFLLRTFAINWLLVLFVWMIWMIPAMQHLTMWFMKGTADQANMYMVWMIGFWKIANVLLFLAPALAAWWEMCMMEKKM